MDVKKTAPGFERVDAQLGRLEQHFDIEKPTGARLQAVKLGEELASLASRSPDLFRLADKRLTQIVERMIGNEMGAVAGAVERAFHGGVAGAASDSAVLAENARSKRQRGL